MARYVSNAAGNLLFILFDFLLGSEREPSGGSRSQLSSPKCKREACCFLFLAHRSLSVSRALGGKRLVPSVNAVEK